MQQTQRREKLIFLIDQQSVQYHEKLESCSILPGVASPDRTEWQKGHDEACIHAGSL